MENVKTEFLNTSISILKHYPKQRMSGHEDKFQLRPVHLRNSSDQVAKSVNL